MIDAFRIGVSIAFTSNATQVLGLLLRDLGRVHGAVEALKSNWAGLAPIAAGAVAAFGGVKVLEGLFHLVEATKELNAELERTKLMGGEIGASVDQARSTAFRLSTSSVPTMAPHELVALEREMASQVGLQEAKELVPFLGRMKAVLEQSSGKSVGNDALLDLYKAVEIRGGAYEVGPDGQRHFSMEKFTREMNAAQAAVRQSGGLVSPHDMRMGMQQAGPAVRNMPPEFAYPFMAEGTVQMGAQRFGTAQMSLAQQFIGGVMTQRTAKALTDAGLLGKDEYKVERGGHILMSAEAKKRFEQMFADPVAYVRDVLMPKLQKQGADAFEQLATLYGVFGRQTTQRAMSEEAQNYPQFLRARENAAKVPGVEESYAELHAHSIDFNLKELTEAWKGFREAFDQAGVIIPILHGLTSALHFLTETIVAHPNMASALVALTGALAGLAVVGGTITAFTFAMTPFTAALSGLAGIAGLGALGGALSSVALGLSKLIGIAGPIGTFLGIMKPSPTNKGESDDLKKWYQDHPDLKPGQPGVFHDTPSGDRSAVPPPGNNQTIQVHSEIKMDGRKVGEAVTEHQTSQASRPPSGTTRVDPRMSPIYSGVMLAP